MSVQIDVKIDDSVNVVIGTDDLVSKPMRKRGDENEFLSVPEENGFLSITVF